MRLSHVLHLFSAPFDPPTFNCVFTETNGGVINIRLGLYGHHASHRWELECWTGSESNLSDVPFQSPRRPVSRTDAMRCDNCCWYSRTKRLALVHRGPSLFTHYTSSIGLAEVFPSGGYRTFFWLCKDDRSSPWRCLTSDRGCVVSKNASTNAVAAQLLSVRCFPLVPSPLTISLSNRINTTLSWQT